MMAELFKVLVFSMLAKLGAAAAVMLKLELLSELD